MQENIICDTNIWYDIAKGKIKPSQIEGLNLIATGLNIQEIASSPLLLRNIQLVKDTYLSIKEFSSFIIKTSPFEHLFSLFDPNHKSYNNIDSLIDGFEFLLKIEDISSLPQSNIDKMKSSYDRLTGIYKPITDKLNNILEEARKEVASLGGKKIHRKKNFVVSWKKYIAFLINNYTESNYNKELLIKIDNKNWKELDFFLCIWDEYFKLLEIDKTRRFHRNDWSDLFNLVYVQSGYKYWTNDKKWQRDLELSKDCITCFYNLKD